MPEIPLSLVAPIRLSATSPAGFLISHKPAGIKMLAFNWDNQAYAMYLEGDYAFRYFPVKPGVSVRGLLIEKIEYLVEPDTAYDAVQQSDPLGALVLQGGQLSIVGVVMGEAFGEPVEVELPGKFAEGTSEEKVGFAGWSIIARDGDKQITLWTKKPPATSDDASE